MAKGKVGFGWGYLLIGLLLTVVGVAFMAFSNVMMTLAVIIGVALIAFGVVYIAIAFSRQSRDFGFAVKLIVAIMCITAGIITIILREGAVLVMADIFCLLLIVDGSFKFQTAALSKRYKAFGWWIMLALSVITIASAFIVSKIKTPETETGLITVIIGIIIIVDGIANFFTAFYEAYCERQRLSEVEKPEVEEALPEATEDEEVEDEEVEDTEERDAEPEVDEETEEVDTEIDDEDTEADAEVAPEDEALVEVAEDKPTEDEVTENAPTEDDTTPADLVEDASDSVLTDDTATKDAPVTTVDEQA